MSFFFFRAHSEIDNMYLRSWDKGLFTTVFHQNILKLQTSYSTYCTMGIYCTVHTSIQSQMLALNWNLDAPSFAWKTIHLWFTKAKMINGFIWPQHLVSPSQMNLCPEKYERWKYRYCALNLGPNSSISPMNTNNDKL